MEENQESTTPKPAESPNPDVSFPTVGQSPKSGGPKTLLIVGILILVGILGFVIYKSSTNKEEELVEPTPFDNLTEPQTGTVATPTPSATVKPADKAAVEIQIQNGTGITGEAAYLETQLKNLGYTNIKIGNATDQTATATTVTFAKSLASDVVSELTQKLNSIYEEVTVKTATSTTFDVVIITGLRKGATAKPSATPKPSASPTPTPTPTATP